LGLGGQSLDERWDFLDWTNGKSDDVSHGLSSLEVFSRVPLRLLSSPSVIDLLLVEEDVSGDGWDKGYWVFELHGPGTNGSEVIRHDGTWLEVKLEVVDERL